MICARTLYPRPSSQFQKKITLKSTRRERVHTEIKKIKKNKKKQKNIRFSVMCCQSCLPGVTCHSLDVIYSFRWSLKIEVRPDRVYFYRNMRR